MKALPASDLSVVPDFLGGTELRFAATTWNSGDGPLELIAGQSGSGQQNVYQRIYLDDGGTYDRLAGTFVWHPDHVHFHLEDYALYSLQPVDAPGGSQRTSSKTSFCVMDTTRIDSGLPGAPNQPVYTTCDPDIQGMSVGWGDEYGSHLAGQEIDLTDLPDGDYSLTIESDPKGRLLEINETDNTSCMLLRISVTNLTVEILNNNGCGGSGGSHVVVSAIAPDTVPRNSVTPVTITGSGFAAGMDVSFENGKGPRPLTSGVTVLDPNTVTALVTTKRGGPPSPQTWDVRVGAGVLTGGITVQP